MPTEAAVKAEEALIHVLSINAGLIVINKTDLLPYVNFDLDACAGYATSLNAGVNILPLSATTGDAISEWYEWVATLANQPRIRDRSADSVDKRGARE